MRRRQTRFAMRDAPFTAATSSGSDMSPTRTHWRPCLRDWVAAACVMLYRNAFRGFAFEASEAAARALASDPAVAYVEEDAVITATGAQSLSEDDSWGLDRIDQRAIVMNGASGYDRSYRYSAEGAGVNVYVVDTGIRTTHVEFGGRAFAAFNARPSENEAGDCHGHGTHVAGTVGGARSGVAKGVTLHSVRVMGCDGYGYMSDLLAGIDRISTHGVRPAVINMSIESAPSDAFNDSARGALAVGITFVAAAGNGGVDACDGMVGGVPGLIVVGGSMSGDERLGTRITANASTCSPQARASCPHSAGAMTNACIWTGHQWHHRTLLEPPRSTSSTVPTRRRRKSPRQSPAVPPWA